MAEVAQADVRVFFTNMTINDCNEAGTCDWKLSCSLGNQQETEFFSMVEANTNEKVPINRILSQKEFPPVTVNCTVQEHDGGIGAEWEAVGSGSVIVNTTGNHLIRLNQHRDEGDVTVNFTAEMIGSTRQPLTTGASFKSVNYPDRYIRHKGFLGYLEPINKNDEVGKGDATFIIVPGLAGRCNSFESINYPGHFLRHQNYRLKLAKQTNEQLFREDATFCTVNGLANSTGSSFESVNFPKHYIRHRDFELWLSPFEDSQLFREDATFIITQPVHTSDTESIPADN